MKNCFTSMALVFSLFLIGCSTEDDSTTGINVNVNRQQTGSSANELLSAEDFSSMRIELLSVEGQEPSSSAISELNIFLQERLYKPGGIEFISRSIPSTGANSVSIETIAETEMEHRTEYNDASTIAVSILFLDASSSNDTQERRILGSAYWNTSIVVFGKTIQETADQANVTRANIESTTLQHEFGHLLGLVGIGSSQQTSHEDTQNNGHCTEDDCLMRASAAFGGGLIDILNSSNVPDLGPQCISDLQANGGR